MSIAALPRPIDAETRETPPRHLAVIAISDEGVVIAVEEDGLLSRILFSEVVIGWRWETDHWVSLNSQFDEPEGDVP